MADKKKKKVTLPKKVTVGESITLKDSVIVIKIRGAATKELDKLPKDERRIILNEAIRLSKVKGHPYDIGLEDVLEAERITEG